MKYIPDERTLVKARLVAAGLLLVATATGCPQGGQKGPSMLPDLPRLPGIPVSEANGAVSGPGVAIAPPGTSRDPEPDGQIRNTSTLLVRVAWPRARGAQLLPVSTRTLRVTVRDSADVLVGDLVLSRSAGSVESAGEIGRLPAGPVKVRATALDAASLEVAAGERSLTLVPNKRAVLEIELQPTRQPAITGIAPLAGGPGTQVVVSGANFPIDAETEIAVKVGGTAVETANVQVFGADVMAFILPPGATTGAVVVSVDGLSTASAQVFTTVASLSLSPVSGAALATGSSRTFLVTAFDTSSAPSPVPGASIAWSLALAGGDGIGFGSALPGTLSLLSGTSDGEGVASCSFLATATGSGIITARSGSVAATAAVEVD